jgi:acetyltransferase
MSGADAPPAEPGAAAASLRALFAPRSVAVVGASATAGKAGNAMLASLRRFDGELWAVNPRAPGQIDGVPCAPAARALPQAVDLAVLCVPAAAVPDAVADCAAAGVGAAVVCAGGLREAGAEGAQLEARAAQLAREAGMRLLGPNTSGFLAPARGLYATFVRDAHAVPAGPLGIVAQSGGVNHALAFAAAGAGLGVRLAAGLGNAADVDAAAAVRWLAADEGTRAIALALEGVRDGRALFEAIAEATERVPVVVLKAGRSDVDALARSHTGALLGSWELARAALRQAGAVAVETTTQLVDAAAALSRRRARPAARPAAAIVSGQAGPALLLADVLGQRGGALAAFAAPTREALAQLVGGDTYLANPVDTGRPGPAFAAVVETVRADPAVAATVVYAIHEPDAIDPCAAVGDAAGSPLLFATAGPAPAVAETAGALAARGVPTYDAPERAAVALAALLEDARHRHRRAPGAGAATAADARGRHHGAPDAGGATASDAGGRHRHALGVDRATAAALPGLPRPLATGALDEASLKAALATHGLHAPERVVVDGHEAARAALRTLGGPLVVKALDAAIAHKTEAGAVHLGVRDEHELARALGAIDRASTTGRYLLERQAGPGVELLLGVRRDPSWGAVVLLALGGTAAEALGRSAMRLAPLGPADTHELIDELDADRLLDGFRGLPPVDRDALAEAILALAELLLASPAVEELEVNPLRATAEGLLALDALATAR